MKINIEKERQALKKTQELQELQELMEELDSLQTFDLESDDLNNDALTANLYKKCLKNCKKLFELLTENFDDNVKAIIRDNKRIFVIALAHALKNGNDETLTQNIQAFMVNEPEFIIEILEQQRITDNALRSAVEALKLVFNCFMVEARKTQGCQMLFLPSDSIGFYEKYGVKQVLIHKVAQIISQDSQYKKEKGSVREETNIEFLVRVFKQKDFFLKLSEAITKQDPSEEIQLINSSKTQGRARTSRNSLSTQKGIIAFMVTEEEEKKKAEEKKETKEEEGTKLDITTNKKDDKWKKENSEKRKSIIPTIDLTQPIFSIKALEHFPVLWDVYAVDWFFRKNPNFVGIKNYCDALERLYAADQARGNDPKNVGLQKEYEAAESNFKSFNKPERGTDEALKLFQGIIEKSFREVAKHLAAGEVVLAISRLYAMAHALSYCFPRYFAVLGSDEILPIVCNRLRSLKLSAEQLLSAYNFLIFKSILIPEVCSKNNFGIIFATVCAWLETTLLEDGHVSQDTLPKFPKTDSEGFIHLSKTQQNEYKKMADQLNSPDVISAINNEFLFSIELWKRFNIMNYDKNYGNRTSDKEINTEFLKNEILAFTQGKISSLSNLLQYLMVWVNVDNSPYILQHLGALRAELEDRKVSIQTISDILNVMSAVIESNQKLFNAQQLKDKIFKYVNSHKNRSDSVSAKFLHNLIMDIHANYCALINQGKEQDAAKLICILFFILKSYLNAAQNFVANAKTEKGHEFFRLLVTGIYQGFYRQALEKNEEDNLSQNINDLMSILTTAIKKNDPLFLEEKDSFLNFVSKSLIPWIREERENNSETYKAKFDLLGSLFQIIYLKETKLAPQTLENTIKFLSKEEYDFIFNELIEKDVLFPYPGTLDEIRLIVLSINQHQNKGHLAPVQACHAFVKIPAAYQANFDLLIPEIIRIFSGKNEDHKKDMKELFLKEPELFQTIFKKEIKRIEEIEAKAIGKNFQTDPDKKNIGKIAFLFNCTCIINDCPYIMPMPSMVIDSKDYQLLGLTEFELNLVKTKLQKLGFTVQGTIYDCIVDNSQKICDKLKPHNTGEVIKQKQNDSFLNANKEFNKSAWLSTQPHKDNQDFNVNQPFKIDQYK